MARKPPKSPEQRLARWSRSMAPGTLNGRVASATPLTVDLTRLAPRLRQRPESTVIENVNTVTASGSAQTLPDVTSATMHDVTLTANCTFTFPPAGKGKSFSLRTKQDGTGSRIPTWPGTVKWQGGTAPTLSTGAGKSDLLAFVCFDGTTWDAVLASLDSR